MRTRGTVKAELQLVTTKLQLDPQNSDLQDQYVRLTAEFGKCCTGLREFLRVYYNHLKHFRTIKPEDYSWEWSQLNDVYLRMSRAIERGTFNKGSDAIKATCKELGIPHTYKAIKEFIK